MALTATLSSGNEYRVSGTYGGETVSEWPVVVKAGGSAADAVTALEAYIDGLDSSAQATQIALNHVQRVKIECRRRIYAVADPDAQINLASARAAGLLTALQETTYATGLGWIVSMRAQCAVLAADQTLDYLSDAQWIAVPAGVAELAALY